MWNKIIIICFLLSINNSFGQKEGWIENFPEAFELSAETGKPILANFTGSDWCGWCVKLDNDVFQTEEFKTWAEENVILLELDFPRRKKLDPEIEKNNNYLQSIFRVRGFPTIWVFTVKDLIQADGTKKFSINAEVNEGGDGWQRMGYMSSPTNYTDKYGNTILGFITKANNIISTINTTFKEEEKSE